MPWRWWEGSFTTCAPSYYDCGYGFGGGGVGVRNFFSRTDPDAFLFRAIDFTARVDVYHIYTASGSDPFHTHRDSDTGTAYYAASTAGCGGGCVATSHTCAVE
jgi:hypothetical protein